MDLRKLKTLIDLVAESGAPDSATKSIKVLSFRKSMMPFL